MHIFYLPLIFCLIIGNQSCRQISGDKNSNQTHLENKPGKFKNESGQLRRPRRVCEIDLPSGFYRNKVDSLSFAGFLRNLPLDTIDNTIYAYDGTIISRGGYHNSIIKMDIGNQDLQQCADAVMRLRAEYLFGRKLYNKIHFNFLSDRKPRYFSDYAKGNYSYKNFRKYMDYIFSYANTSSLKDELQLVNSVKEMQIGDVFIQKGSPVGHAVIVVDMAVNKDTGKKIFMVAESYMPAQSIHILSNLDNSELDPWYPVDFENSLVLPSWVFYKDDLRRFKAQ